jgi:hypothetical protein
LGGRLSGVRPLPNFERREALSMSPNHTKVAFIT